MFVGWNWGKRWEFKLMMTCKQQCHCTCSLEIGTWIHMMLRDRLHTKTNKNTRFVGTISTNDVLYSCIYYLSTQRKASISEDQYPVCFVLSAFNTRSSIFSMFCFVSVQHPKFNIQFAKFIFHTTMFNIDIWITDVLYMTLIRTMFI